VSLGFTIHDTPEVSQYRGPREAEVTMNTSNAKHMPKDALPGSEHANTPNQSPEGKTAKAARALDPKSAEHVCTPACTHEGAKKNMSTQAGEKGTQHATAAHDTTGGGAARGGK
jgi:hypothetical protein